MYLEFQEDCQQEKSQRIDTGISKSEASWSIYNGDAIEVLKTFPDESYHCIVTSPPYFWLRDYGVDGQLGLEETVAEYISSLCAVMDEARRVLRKDGVLFLNLGDTYYSGKGKSHGTDKKSSKRRFGLRAVDKSGGLDIGIKPKSLIGIPWRVAMEMINREWILRSPIVWYRKYALPEAVQDRPKRSYEHVFMFVKSRKYYFNRQTLEDEEQEDMWTIVARPKATHLGTAPFPNELVKRCLDIGCPSDGTVLDPFAGGGTTLRVALESGRSTAGIELNPDFCQYITDDLRSI
jgi:DNA modification methylase